MKTYQYTCFLRNPHTLDARHFNIEIDWEESEFMDFPNLLRKLHEAIGQMPEGYTLIGMNCIDVIVKGDTSEE